MEMARRVVGTATILTCTGELDAFNLPPASEEIEQLIGEGCTRLVFNLSGLVSIDSSALGYLLKMKKRVCQERGELVVSQPSPFVHRVITTLGIERIIQLFPTDEDAIQALGGTDAEA